MWACSPVTTSRSCIPLVSKTASQDPKSHLRQSPTPHSSPAPLLQPSVDVTSGLMSFLGRPAVQPGIKASVDDGRGPAMPAGVMSSPAQPLRHVEKVATTSFGAESAYVEGHEEHFVLLLYVYPCKRSFSSLCGVVDASDWSTPVVILDCRLLRQRARPLN